MNNYGMSTSYLFSLLLYSYSFYLNVALYSYCFPTGVQVFTVTESVVPKTIYCVDKIVDLYAKSVFKMCLKLCTYHTQPYIKKKSQNIAATLSR